MGGPIPVVIRSVRLWAGSTTVGQVKGVGVRRQLYQARDQNTFTGSIRETVQAATHDVGAVSARKSRKLVVGLSHLHVALNVWGRQALLILQDGRLILVTVEEVLRSSERVHAGSNIEVGHVGPILTGEVIGRQRVPVQATSLLAFTCKFQCKNDETHAGPGRKVEVEEDSMMKSSFSEFRREPGRE